MSSSSRRVTSTGCAIMLRVTCLPRDHHHRQLWNPCYQIGYSSLQYALDALITLSLRPNVFPIRSPVSFKCAPIALCAFYVHDTLMLLCAALVTVLRLYTVLVRTPTHGIHAQNKRRGSALQVVHGDCLASLPVLTALPSRSQRPYCALPSVFILLRTQWERHLGVTL